MSFFGTPFSRGMMGGDVHTFGLGYQRRPSQGHKPLGFGGNGIGLGMGNRPLPTPPASQYSPQPQTQSSGLGASPSSTGLGLGSGQTPASSPPTGSSPVSYGLGSSPPVANSLPATVPSYGMRLGAPSFGISQAQIQQMEASRQAQEQSQIAANQSQQASIDAGSSPFGPAAATPASIPGYTSIGNGAYNPIGSSVTPAPTQWSPDPSRPLSEQYTSANTWMNMIGPGGVSPALLAWAQQNNGGAVNRPDLPMNETVSQGGGYTVPGVGFFGGSNPGGY